MISKGQKLKQIHQKYTVLWSTTWNVPFYNIKKKEIFLGLGNGNIPAAYEGGRGAHKADFPSPDFYPWQRTLRSLTQIHVNNKKIFTIYTGPKPKI